MSFWVDDFEGNKLNPKWVPTRMSGGGQNDGVYAHEVKDSKIRFTASNRGTESGYWGELIALPVNATGDAIIEACLRHKSNNSTGPEGIGIGFNQLGFTFNVNRGIFFYNGGLQLTANGRNAGGAINLPAHPNMAGYTYSYTGDAILNARVVRKNGYLFFYGNNVFLGSYAYNNALTDVSITAHRYTTAFSSELYCDWIKVWPKEVVL